jgi:hypothetical protein
VTPFFAEEGKLQKALLLTSTGRGVVAQALAARVAPISTRCKMGWIFGIIYFALLITLGIISLRKGHWVMFILGLFIPLFWFIGALVPRVARR